jgi:acetyltransferase-like isoleucine patch superfamily enzyme
LSTRGLIGSSFLDLYRLWVRARAKTFSLVAAGAFGSFGIKTVIEPPIRLNGEARMAIGNYVYIGGGSWLHVLDGHSEGIALRVGDGTNIVGACVLSAALSLVIGENVLMARNVYIADHMHAFDDTTSPVIKQGITRIAPVEIGDGAWLGENVVVGPGVHIGRGAVIGANAVVLDDVEDHCVAVGAPARTVRSLTPSQPQHLDLNAP